MLKKYILVQIKTTGEVRIFPTITQMYTLLGEEAIGITKNSLWNALSKKNGKYENSRVKVAYKGTMRQVWK